MCQLELRVLEYYGDADVLKCHAGCFADTWSRKNRLGAWNTMSPWKADMRLYCGESWLSSPVPNGEPSAGSFGYRVNSGASSSRGALGKK